MKGFKRENPLFSLCGMNCGLCSMHLGGHCGGCGFGNQSCPIARCSLEHGSIEYCFQCGEYPCERYEYIDEYDSFITHQKRKADLHKAQQCGIEKYNVEQKKKAEILDHLLDQYNDGRKKTLFCLAVNLLESDELEAIVKRADSETSEMPRKEKAAFVSALLQQHASENGFELKLKKRK